MFSRGVHGVIMLKINTRNFGETFKPVRKRYENLEKKMKRSEFGFNHVSKLAM